MLQETRRIIMLTSKIAMRMGEYYKPLGVLTSLPRNNRSCNTTPSSTAYADPLQQLQVHTSHGQVGQGYRTHVRPSSTRKVAAALCVSEADITGDGGRQYVAPTSGISVNSG